MPSNNRKIEVGWLAGRFPGRLAFLFPPNGWSIPPKWMPFACDNGAFSAYKNNATWDEDAFLMLLSRAKAYNPMWVAVPDVVADKDKTIEQWHRWAERLSGFTLAFVVQDGMVASDVPKEADVVFVGGTTTWKWRTAPKWCADFPRVHIGRVNTYRLLWMAHDAGAESCDGTGWFRGSPDQYEGMVRYLEESTTGIRPQRFFHFYDKEGADEIPTGN